MKKLMIVILLTLAVATMAEAAYYINMIKLGEPLPESSRLLLLGSGLMGLAGYGRRRFRK